MMIRSAIFLAAILALGPAFEDDDPECGDGRGTSGAGRTPATAVEGWRLSGGLHAKGVASVTQTSDAMVRGVSPEEQGCFA